MKITPLSAGFGATIEGIDLRQASAEEQHTVRSALLQHGLLVILQRCHLAKFLGKPEHFREVLKELQGQAELV